MADLSNGMAWFAAAASLLLLVVSAFVSGSEIAFFSLGPGDRSALSEAEDERSRAVLDLLEGPGDGQGPRQLLATILVLNNAVNILIILLSTVLMQHWLPAMPAWLSVLLQVFGVTFLIVLFGEVLPKVHANRNPLGLARTMARPLKVARTVLRPAWQPMNALAASLSSRVETAPPDLSVEDLEHAVQVTDSEERTEEEKRILSGIVNFGSKDVKQIMTPVRMSPPLPMTSTGAGSKGTWPKADSAGSPSTPTDSTRSRASCMPKTCSPTAMRRTWTGTPCSDSPSSCRKTG